MQSNLIILFKGSS